MKDDCNGCKSFYYYSNDNSTAEIDFVIQTDYVYPIEVKAEENLKAKSLTQALKTNENLNGLRFSMSDYREEERMTNVPLYLAECFWKINWFVILQQLRK